MEHGGLTVKKCGFTMKHGWGFNGLIILKGINIAIPYIWGWGLLKSCKITTFCGKIIGSNG